MEKLRSFSIKRTPFLFFSFTICLTLIFLVFFSIWVFKLTSFPQETHIQLNSATFLHMGSIPFTGQTLLGFKKVHSNFDFQEKENQSKVAAAGEVLNGNFTFSAAYFSSIVVNDTFTADTNISGFGINQEHISSVSSLIKKRTEKKSGGACDVTNGEWVFGDDGESYPLYTNISCPFIDEGFSCQANGRPDKDYMKWRWQPQDCSIPRFNATHMLELIRGKRLVFVGDSINRNQWESMLCLLTGAIKDKRNVYETRGRRITKGKGDYSFKFVDYKCTVEFYVTHFLVRESKVRMGKKRRQTLRIDAIDRGSSRWRGADILVFNTAHWWSHHKTKAGMNYYQEGGQVHEHLNVSTAYQRALTTWASWVDRNINPRKTRVFFRTSSPSHFSGGQWDNGGHCREASHPLRERRYRASYPEKNMIVEQVIKQMKTPVTLINITGLSDYRVDGHPSIYGSKSGVQDCSHWCLPGVPDTWNEILYYHILQLAV